MADNDASPAGPRTPSRDGLPPRTPSKLQEGISRNGSKPPDLREDLADSPNGGKDDGSVSSPLAKINESLRPDEHRVHPAHHAHGLSFSIPQSLVLKDEGEDGISVECNGDIILHSLILGRPFSRICSRRGHVHLTMKTIEAKEILAPEGNITIHGDTTVGALHGQSTSFDGNLRAREVRCASMTVTGNLDVDCISAESGGVRVQGDAKINEELTVSGGDLTIEGNLQSDAECLYVPSGSVAVSSRAEFKRLETSRDARFVGDLKASEVCATRKLLVGGNAEALTLRAGVVQLRGSTVKVRVVQGMQQIHVGPSEITAHVFIAPAVHLDPAISGVLKVLEAQQLDQRPPGLKGCLHLQDLVDLLGPDHVEDFLGNHKINRLEQTVASWDENSSLPALSPEKKVGDGADSGLQKLPVDLAGNLVGGRRHSGAGMEMDRANPARTGSVAAAVAVAEAGASKGSKEAPRLGSKDAKAPGAEKEENTADAAAEEAKEEGKVEDTGNGGADNKVVDGQKEAPAAEAPADEAKEEGKVEDSANGGAVDKEEDGQKEAPAAEAPADEAPPVAAGAASAPDGAKAEEEASKEEQDDAEQARAEARRIRKERKSLRG